MVFVFNVNIEYCGRGRRQNALFAEKEHGLGWAKGHPLAYDEAKFTDGHRSWYQILALVDFGHAVGVGVTTRDHWYPIRILCSDPLRLGRTILCRSGISEIGNGVHHPFFFVRPAIFL